MADEIDLATATAEASAVDLEATPEFQTWKPAKLQEVLNYLRINWSMEGITLDKLVMEQIYVFPDPKNKRGFASVSSGQSFRDPATNMIAINPATGQPMTSSVWRKIDLPAEVPAPASEPEATDTI